MKKTFLTLLSSVLMSGALFAQFVNPNYTSDVFYTEYSSSDVTFFAFSSGGDLYYQDGAGTLKKATGANSGEELSALGGGWPGAGVAVVGDHVYYNGYYYGMAQAIFLYDTVTKTDAPFMVENYSFTYHGGKLFCAGAAAVGIANAITHVSINPDGTLDVGSLTGLADTGDNASGPVAFDAAGNLYYATGYSYSGFAGILRWSAAEVAYALATGTVLAPDGHEFYDFSSLGYAGGTSMVLDGDGNILLTLTDFMSTSELRKFTLSGGAVVNSEQVFLGLDYRIGDVAYFNGKIYLASGDSVYALQLIPEPTSALLLLCGIGSLAIARRRKSSLANS